LQVLKQNNSKQKAQRRLGSEGWITPGPRSTRTGAPLPTRGQAKMGCRQSSWAQGTGTRVSPVPLWKSGTNLRRRWFLWDAAVGTCQLVQDNSSVPNGRGAPARSPALPRSHGSSPSVVLEHLAAGWIAARGSSAKLCWKPGLGTAASVCSRIGTPAPQRERAARPSSPRKPPGPVVQPRARCSLDRGAPVGADGPEPQA